MRIEEKDIRFENRDFNIEGTNQRNKQISDLGDVKNFVFLD